MTGGSFPPSSAKDASALPRGVFFFSGIHRRSAVDIQLSEALLADWNLLMVPSRRPAEFSSWPLLALANAGPRGCIRRASARQLGDLVMRHRTQAREPPTRLVFVKAYHREQNGRLVLVTEHWRRWPTRSARMRA